MEEQKQFHLYESNNDKYEDQRKNNFTKNKLSDNTNSDNIDKQLTRLIEDYDSSEISDESLDKFSDIILSSSFKNLDFPNKNKSKQEK
jgi:hypothetical protein